MMHLTLKIYISQYIGRDILHVGILSLGSPKPSTKVDGMVNGS